MPSKYPVPENTPTGSITVAVFDIGGAGGFLSGALVSLYRAPATTTTAGKFNARTWTADEAALLQTGRTDIEGKLTFTGLEPALYVVKYEHYPETQAQCVQVGAGSAVSVPLPLQLQAHLKTAFKNADCEDIRCPDPRVGDRV